MEIGIIKIVDPIEVSNYAASLGDNNPDNGAVFVECPELGFMRPNLLYCRYGLSIPYIQLNKEDKVLISSTIGETERWFYTGLVDAATADPTTDLKLHIEMADYSIILDAGLLTIDMDGTTIEQDKDTITITKGGVILEITDSQINLTGDIRLGSDSAGESFILGDVLDTWISAHIGKYNAHTHTAPLGGGTTTAPLISDSAPTGHLSSKVKGE